MTNQIYADLAKVMRSVDHVGKGDFNSHQKFSFRGIDGVLNAVGPALREHNVVVYPRLHDVAYEGVKTSGGKASTACRVVVDYIIASVDGSTVETRVAAESWDTGIRRCRRPCLSLCVPRLSKPWRYLRMNQTLIPSPIPVRLRMKRMSGWRRRLSPLGRLMSCVLCGRRLRRSCRSGLRQGWRN